MIRIRGALGTHIIGMKVFLRRGDLLSVVVRHKIVVEICGVRDGMCDMRSARKARRPAGVQNLQSEIELVPKLGIWSLIRGLQVG
jgi:hypothetical protein